MSAPVANTNATAPSAMAMIDNARALLSFVDAAPTVGFDAGAVVVGVGEPPGFVS